MTPANWPPDPVPSGTVRERKAAWRALLRAARREVVAEQGPEGRRAHATALADRVLPWLEAYAGSRPGGGLAGATVTAYESMRTEPPVEEIVRRLREAGARVIVPITLPAGVLDWHVAGDPDRRPLGQEVLAEVDVALVPGLGVDRSGVRLGKGGGYYDRVIPRLRPGTPAVVVLHDHEVVDELPAEDFDARVGMVLTAAEGVFSL
ncbi:MAG TPA: 5-formyltetrahydrofolate cyclo-ligase [Ornithinicoccus sp.]|nr:5-formyltetrahydrofolate cyclo-ligase [Ornithinicoccus sp.]